MSTSRGGGAATQAGITYQNRVAAWMAVSILAEQEAASPWDLPASVVLEFLRCETEQPVDDLLIGTSAGGHAFIQVKHGLDLGKDPETEFGKTIDQFIRQFLAYRNGAPGNRSWERPLDPARDRLVVITNSNSSASIRQDLPDLLTKIRALSANRTIQEVTSSSNKLQRVFERISNLITIIWHKIQGNQPTDDEKYEILNLMRVQILDVDAGGNEELQAKDRLKASVLAQATQADVAWATLIQICGDLAVNQSGADQAILQNRLLQNGISLRPVQSYREDIERLRQYSIATATALSEFSEIRVGDRTVKIGRPVTRALKSVAEQDSLLVIGDPGAGKSGAIHTLAKTLIDEQRDVVFLAVDRFEANSARELREELDLDHSLDDVLRQWQSSEPGWLVIDALDAARSATSVKTFRDLTAAVIRLRGRWRVIVSIRKFDLRYSPDLKQLFQSESLASDNFYDPEFKNIRHINISTLTDEELAEIGSQSELLASFVAIAETQLRELLTVPFNLRLVGDLIGAEVNSEHLIPIRTQIELLDLYWNERVIHMDDGLADVREALLLQVVEKMVETRSLRVNRSDVLSHINSETVSRLLKQVLSAHILTEWKPSEGAKFERSILTFAHHVLFDYAVSCLMLRGLPETTVQRLEREFDLVLAIRPSIVFHFQHLWFSNSTRQEFWLLVLQILRSNAIPEIGKLIGPTVASDLIQSISDCESLLETLETAVQPPEHPVYRAFSHLVGAILVNPSRTDRPLVGPDAPPWCELIERLSRSLNRPLFFAVRPLVWNICEQSNAFTASQLNLAGIAARYFFDFAWKENLSLNHFISRELSALCHTFGSNPVDSAKLLRQLLEPESMQNFGYTSIFWLGNHLNLLIAHDVELVKDIYTISFNHKESSNASTLLGGTIVPLSSNRQQDFNTALYGLARSYPHFLEVAPNQATYALVKILEGYVEQSHPIRQVIENRFDFNDQKAVIQTDYSAIWDSSTYRNDYPLEILDFFEKYLKNLSSDASRVNQYREIVDIIAAENRLAILWRCLLRCGTSTAETLGVEIRSLAWAIPILTSSDTTTVVGEFLKAVFAHLSCDDRERIERAIISIPDVFDDEFSESGEHMRNRLVGCLARQALVTSEAQKLVDDLTTRNEVPSNKDPFEISEVTVTPYGEREHLLELGVPIDEKPNQRIQTLEEPIKAFSEQYLNASPTESDVANIFPTLQSLYEALRVAQTDGVHPEQCNYGWGRLAEACERVTRIKTLNCMEDVGVFVKQVLLEASEHPEPVYHPTSDEQFNRFPSWGSPAARIDAAEGLTRLAQQSTCLDETLLFAIERLSHDPVPAVRYQVACCILSLYQTAPDQMWQTIDRMCHEEENRGVLQGLLPVMSRLSGTHGERIAELSRVVFLRAEEGDGSDKVKEYCTSILTGLYLWQDNATAAEVVSTIANQLNLFHREARRLLMDLRDYLTIGSIPAADLLEEQVRQKAFLLMSQILQSVLVSLQTLEKEHQQSLHVAWSTQDQQTVSDLAQVADAIAMELYFASGAYDDERILSEANNQGSEKRTAATLGILGKQRFFQEANSILDDLSTLGFSHLAHRVLETLVFLVDVDPKQVLLKVGQVVRSGKSGSYQYESLGADLVVQFIERFLAEYRYVLRRDEHCRRVLIEVLDTFVQAGWSSARRLTYRMEEIFR